MGAYEIPCRVSADLRIYEASQRPEFTQEELDEARDELVDALLGGHTCHGWNLEACLDCEMNENEKFVRELAAFGRLTRCVDAPCLPADFGKWCEEIVARHLPEQAIEDRAAQIRADKAEDADE